MDDDPAPGTRAGTLEVLVSSAVGRLPLGRARVATIAEEVLRGERCGAAMLTVSFVSERAIARPHRRHLQVDGPTDIITFQHASTHRGGPRVGDIYIAPGIARRNARAAGCSWREELARLTIHGVLHSLGWEHPDGGERTRSTMWRRQERWVARLAAKGAW